MIQNGISLTVKNDINSFLHEDQSKDNQEDKAPAPKKSNSPFQGFFQASKKQAPSAGPAPVQSTGFSPKGLLNLLINEAGTMQRELIFKPEFEKYLIYQVGNLKSNIQDELPYERINEWAKIHIRNNYKFIEHVHETNCQTWVTPNF